jgi:hypothetical protein
VAKVRIHCDGGLGNRYGALISGLIVAQRMNAEPLVYWPRNTNCGAGLDDLYAALPFEYSDNLPPTDWPVMAHMDWHGRTCHRITDASMKALQGQDIEFSSDKLVGTPDQAREWLARFQLQPEIAAHIEDFCRTHQVDKTVTGVHMRRTDNTERNEAQHLLNRITASGDRFFVCSDDLEFEQRLTRYPNVIIHPKQHAVAKIQEGGWRIPPPPDNPTAVYNVDRSREQVIEAFEDMHILARTTFRCTRSTFCQWAKHL